MQTSFDQRRDTAHTLAIPDHIVPMRLSRDDLPTTARLA
jgi:hypothetical protein